MLKRLSITVILILCSVQPGFSQPMFQDPSPRITVSGSAEVKVIPDVVYLRLGVETRDVNLDPARRQNDDRIEDVLKFLRKKGVPDKNIKTDFMNVYPEFDYNVSRTKAVNYVARKSVEVKLTDLRKFEEIMSGVLEHGVNYVHGIDFRTSELRKHRDEARAMAAQAAKEKADAMAGALGVHRGKVISIDENSWYGWGGGSASWGSQGGMQYQNMVQNSMQSGRGGGESDEGSLSLGQISVTATVNASFAIE